MAKKNKSTTPPKEVSRKHSPVWSLLSNEAQQLFPASQQTYERLAYTMCNYFYQDPEAFTLKDFYFAYGISEVWFLTLIKRSPLLKQAHSLSKDIIARKRRQELLKKDSPYRPQALEVGLQAYDPEFKEYREWIAGLQRQKETDDLVDALKLSNLVDKSVVGLWDKNEKPD